MTARQSRTERRAAERKARKIARKSGKPLPAGSLTGDPIASPPDEQRQPAARFVSQSIRGVPQPAPSLRAETNRANVQHSTGPRTPEGKLASSRNSLKHGLASAQLIIPGEDPAAFEALLADLLHEHQPANPTEQLLVQEIAQSHWLTQRALRFQNQCFAAESVDEKRLALFLRYQTTHERAFHKALNTLIRLKKDRAPRFVSQNVNGHPSPHQFVSQNAIPHGFVPQEYMEFGTRESVRTGCESLKAA